MNRREVYFRSRINRVGNEEQVRNDSPFSTAESMDGGSKAGDGEDERVLCSYHANQNIPLVVTVIKYMF